MTCEEYLMSYRNALDSIRDLDMEIREEEIRQQKATAKYDGNQVGGSREPNAKLDPLGDLILRREKLVQAAEEKRTEIQQFIRSVGGGSEDDKRSRQLLRLYYTEEYDWKEVQQMVKPLRKRKDGRVCRSGRRSKYSCVSETTLFRARHEALAKAENTWRRLGRYR